MSGTWDHLDQISLTYTPPQKKGNFRKVVFLLGKSIHYLGLFVSDLYEYSLEDRSVFLFRKVSKIPEKGIF